MVFPATNLIRSVLIGLNRTRFSSLGTRGGQAGGGFSIADAGAVVHGSSVFFCLFVVIASGYELFARLRKG